MVPRQPHSWLARHLVGLEEHGGELVDRVLQCQGLELLQTILGAHQRAVAVLGSRQVRIDERLAHSVRFDSVLDLDPELLELGDDIGECGYDLLGQELDHRCRHLLFGLRFVGIRELAAHAADESVERSGTFVGIDALIGLRRRHNCCLQCVERGEAGLDAGDLSSDRTVAVRSVMRGS